MSLRQYNGHVRLVLFDVDGVLTDGTLFVGVDGETVKRFNARDGVAVALLRAHGIDVGVISGRSSAALDRRLRELAIDVAECGVEDKLVALASILDRTGLWASQVAYVGDDIIDIPVGAESALFLAPADAHPLVARQATLLRTAGGQGVAREAAEFVLSVGGLDIDAAYEPLINRPGVARVVQ